MEIYLALVVIAAVLFFGALISLGNERQRKAIDGIREQTELWAIQDLRIKRERVAREIKVDDPLLWLNQMATSVLGFELNLQIVESFDAPFALLCISADQENRMLISPFSLQEIKRMKREQRSQLSKFGQNNPLLSLPRTISVREISVLNAGIFFDLELQLAWKLLVGRNSSQFDKLWIYMI